MKKYILFIYLLVLIFFNNSIFAFEGEVPQYNLLFFLGSRENIDLNTDCLDEYDYQQNPNVNLGLPRPSKNVVKQCQFYIYNFKAGKSEKISVDMLGKLIVQDPIFEKKSPDGFLLDPFCSVAIEKNLAYFRPPLPPSFTGGNAKPAVQHCIIKDNEVILINVPISDTYVKFLGWIKGYRQ